MTGGWSYRDLDIIESLTRRVRLLTAVDIASIWWPSSCRSRSRRQIRRLRQAGLVTETLINAHPAFKVTTPIVEWAPGQSAPNLEIVVTQVQLRWDQPATPIKVYAASRLAANLWGSTAGSLPNRTHWDHDLLLGRVYTLYRRTRAQEAQRWIGEDSLPKAGYRIKDPDAFLVNDVGDAIRVIESAGRYGLRQLESFQFGCVLQCNPRNLQ